MSCGFLESSLSFTEYMAGLIGVRWNKGSEWPTSLGPYLGQELLCLWELYLSQCWGPDFFFPLCQISCIFTHFFTTQPHLVCLANSHSKGKPFEMSSALWDPPWPLTTTSVHKSPSHIAIFLSYLPSSLEWRRKWSLHLQCTQLMLSKPLNHHVSCILSFWAEKVQFLKSHHFPSTSPRTQMAVGAREFDQLLISLL